MNRLQKTLPGIALMISMSLVALLLSCNKDDDLPKPTGDEVVYELAGVANSSVSGTATFEKLDDSSVRITLSLNGTTAGGNHPAHIHANSAAEGGSIILDLTNVDGSTGMSETVVTMLKDGSALTYESLTEIDGYINVHNSPDDLGTLVAQGDVGSNKLTEQSVEYAINELNGSGISGIATFYQRMSGETLVIVDLEGDASDSDHPSHIHTGSTASPGGIAIDLSNVKAGFSRTNIAAFKDGTPVTYTELIAYAGYINVHNAADDMGTLVAQGDIGSNKLTGESVEYEINELNGSGISGMATFYQRMSGETLVIVDLEGDALDSDHPSHIHTGSTASPGGIAINLSNVKAGFSRTNIDAFKDGTPVTYTELIAYAGYINVHNAADDMGTLVAQGDIGSNKLTGESVEYSMHALNNSGVSGKATFYQRLSGETLVIIDLEGDASDSDHPSHIHTGSSSSPGGIAIDLSNVKAGFSRTNIDAFKDGTPVTYTELIAYEGYINVHNASDDMGTLIAQGNIGSSADVVVITAAYSVTNSGMTAYSFTGGGLTDSSNPDLTLKRGHTYTFAVDATGHPFWINSTQGAGTSNAYNTGVTNNGTSSATVTFSVPADAPNTLFYNCEFHEVMTGTITITD